jgi:hypothetical protein
MNETEARKAMRLHVEGLRMGGGRREQDKMGARKEGR